MTVSKRTRFEVLRRDNHTCRYCGGTAPDVVLTVDHVMPTALGGSDDPSNLVAACRDCNAGKASTSPDSEVVADVKQADLTHAMAMIRAGEIRMAERAKLMDYLGLFETVWLSNSRPTGNRASASSTRPGCSRTTSWTRLTSLRPRATCGDSRFVYFCGVAWKRVRATQEIARALIEADKEGSE